MSIGLLRPRKSHSSPQNTLKCLLRHFQVYLCVSIVGACGIHATEPTRETEQTCRAQGDVQFTISEQPLMQSILNSENPERIATYGYMLHFTADRNHAIVRNGGGDCILAVTSQGTPIYQVDPRSINPQISSTPQLWPPEKDEPQRNREFLNCSHNTAAYLEGLLLIGQINAEFISAAAQELTERETSLCSELFGADEYIIRLTIDGEIKTYTAIGGRILGG